MGTSSPFDFLNTPASAGAQPSAPVSAVQGPSEAPPETLPSQTSFDFLNQPSQGGGEPASPFLESQPQQKSILEHDESDRFTQENPGDNWLEKSWSFLNKPLTESLFGWGQYRQGAGGLERGVEKIAAGITAPISLLTLAAFAPAGIAEGVAGSVLKEGLTEGGTLLGEEALDGTAAALKVEKYAQAVDAAKKAQLAGNSIESAVETTGLPYQDFLNMGQYLRNQGMRETDVLGENLARRTISQGLRKAGVGPDQALRIAKGAETLVNAGFGVQQLKGAIYAYPRVMDLMSQGDYDDAAEYMVEAGAGTIFGGLGVAHGLTSIHDIIPGLNEKEQLPLSEEVENIKKVFGTMTKDITSSQTQVSARARAHLADLMEVAGVPVPAGLRERVPFLPEDEARLKELTEAPKPLNEDDSKELTDLQAKKDLSETRAGQTSLGAEISSAIQGILTNKDQRERLLQKQKDFFVALDSGNDRNAAYQKARALTAAFNLDDWLKQESELKGWNFIPPERTIDDIANEESNAVLGVKADASMNKEKLGSLRQDLALATSDLRQADPEEAPAIQQRIGVIQDQINTAQLEQERLDEKYNKAKAWEDPKRREEAFFELYKDHIQDIKDAAESTPWDSPNAKELFYEKVRALGNYPHDLSLIEKEYPHFRDMGFTPQATVSEAPAPAYLFNPEYYTERLANPELVYKSLSVQTPHGEAIAVPVGGERQAGSLDYVYSPSERGAAEQAVKELESDPENFPNPRVVKTGRDSLEVHWGADVNAPITKDQALIILGAERSRAQLNAYLSSEREATDKAEIEEIQKEIDNLKNVLNTVAVPDRGDIQQRILSLEKAKTRAQNSLDISSEQAERRNKEYQDSVDRYKKATAGEIPSDLKLTPESRAELRGKLYGYQPPAVSEFLDENKNYFTGPDVEAAKEFTKTQNFKNWFRNSRVVDENNDPKVVFHGTGADWTKFDPLKAVQGGSLGFHAGSLSQAQDFVREGGSYKKGKFTKPGGKIMPVFLSIQNPLRIEDLGTWRPERVIAKLAGMGIKDPTPMSEVNKPSHIGIADWERLTDAQKKMSAFVHEAMQREIAEGRLPPFGERVPVSVRKSYVDTAEKFGNDYVIDLLERNGYDGLVYKNYAEGELSKGPKGDQDTSGDSYIALHDYQIKSAIANSGEFSRERPDILEKKVFSSEPTKDHLDSLAIEVSKADKKMRDITQALYSLESKKNKGETLSDIEQAKYKMLKNNETDLKKKIADLTFKINETNLHHMGEVHELPDGSKVAYMTRKGFRMLQIAFGMDSVPAGQVFSKGQTQMLVNNIEKLKMLDKTKENLLNLIKKGTNKNGELVTAAIDQGAFDLSDRLWTLREELTHAWQHSLSNVWRDHLNDSDMTDLRKTMPREMVDHLQLTGYGNRPIYLKVIEAAAKLLATNPENTMIPRGELLEYNTLRRAEKSGTLAADQVKRLNELRGKVADVRSKAKTWLGQYFQAIKNKYGDKAFDNLTHVTNTARHWNEEFRNVDNARSKQDAEALGGVGEGRPGGARPPLGGGGAGEPPQPPEPPPSAADDFDWRKFFGPESGGILGDLFPTEYWQTGPQHPSLPANLVEQVNKAKGRNWTEDHKEYIKSMIRSYMHVAQGLTPQELELYKKMRGADDDNWTAGYNNGIIHSIVPNHIHHIWGDDPKKGYPVDAEARSGAFAINATQARHRAWNTAFEGFLQGRKLAVHDPTAIIANDAHQIAQAAGHRKALEILAKGIKQKDGSYVTLKDPEGMPAFVFRGMGRVVPSEDGTKASILVNPNVVKNIQMTDGDIRRLTRAGLLDTYLRDGRVKDLTPQVGQGNVKDWLDATNKKLEKLGETNPLLSSVGERKIHEQGWEDLKGFASRQAQHIAEYLNDALRQIYDAGPIDAKGNFAPIPVEDKPEHINMAKYLGDVLHGKNRRITPANLERIEQYAERNRNYAKGLAGDGNGPIRPHEVSKLVLQEKDFLHPDLQEYLDKHHDIFGQRDADGNWTRKGLNSTIYHIAHAATNQDFPRLIRDKMDLMHVYNAYTSVNPITQALHKEEALKLLKGINERQPKQYLWAPKSHITIDHPSFHGYKWMASSADGTPTLAESDMAVSRHFYPYIVNRLGLEPSWLRRKDSVGKITEPLLRAGSQVKSTILSGSPFHIIQIALRGLMLHVNPFVRPNPISDINVPFEYAPGKSTTLGKGVENSLTLFTDKNAAEDHSVGVASHGGLVSKIPIYGPFTDQIHDFLFNRFIPSVKADAYKQMFKQYANAHPDWSEDAIAYRAAQHTNNAFGGINWREMGRSATTQDWFNLVALAPDWLESEMRFAAGLFNGYGIGPGKYRREEGKNFTRTQVAQAAVVLWTTARLLNQLYSGSPHYESPFGLVVKDKDGRDIEYSVRTMPTDILHAVTDPYGFLVGRTSPLARTTEEMITGRSQYGQKLTDSEKYVDLLSNLSPIWGQAGFKKLTKLSTAADVGGVQQVVKAAGATAQVLRTPAEKTAANLASERSEGGPVNAAQIARHRLLIQLEENLRSGKIANLDLQNMVDQGQLPEADAKNVIKVVKETTGLSPEQARMYSRTSRLDMQGAFAVYDDANPEEKQILHDLIVKKAKSYIKKSLKDETPATRAEDPVFARARRYVPLVPQPTVSEEEQ